MGGTTVVTTNRNPQNSYNTQTADDSVNSHLTNSNIGLTGENAENLMAAILASGAQTEQLRAQTIVALNQDIGLNYQHLIGGANSLIETAKGTSENIIASSMSGLDRAYNYIRDTGQQFIQGGQQIVQDGLSAVKALSPQTGSVLAEAIGTNALPMAILTVIGFFLFKWGAKK